jgi:hypothetical protein
VRGDGLHIEHVLHPRVLAAQEVGQQGRSGLAERRRVQRGRLAIIPCSQYS